MRALCQRVSAEVAREICQRTGGSAVLEAAMGRLGSQYALELRARNCQTGDILAGEQTQASGKEQLVASLGPAAARFTKRIEQSLSKVEKPAPLAPPSLAISPADNSAIANLVSTKVAVPKVATGSVRVSQGVSQGLLVKKVSPTYPPMALQLRKQGAVDLLASVNREGTITGVKVLNGDSVLARSAVEAVRQWKYRPYLLNGEPVEIETQITINFRLPN